MPLLVSTAFLKDDKCQNFPFTDADPNNYMSYYKRATVFLALSRSRPALADLDKVIQLKSDFQAVSVHKL